MKTLLIAFPFLFYFTSLSLVAMTLPEALSKLESSSAWEKLNTELERTENQYGQAKSKLIPNLVIQASSSIYQGENDQKTSAQSAKLNLNHALFAGGQEWYSLGYFQKILAAKKIRTNHDKHMLRLELMELYFSLLHFKTQSQLIEEQISVAKERESYLEKKKRIGQVKTSDLLHAKAQKLSAELALKDNQLLLTAKQDQLSRLLKTPISPIDLSSPKPLSIEPTKNLAKANQLEQEMNTNQEAYESLVKATRSQHIPSLSLDANYYFTNKFTSSSANNRKWDASLLLEVPIYSGGLIEKQVESSLLEKQSLKHQQQMEVDKFQNYLDQLLKNLALGKEQLQEKIQASSLYYRAYQETKKEFDRGLTDNVEVLNAFNAYIQEKKGLEELKNQILKVSYQLQEFQGDSHANH